MVYPDNFVVGMIQNFVAINYRDKKKCLTNFDTYTTVVNGFPDNIDVFISILCKLTRQILLHYLK